MAAGLTPDAAAVPGPAPSGTAAPLGAQPPIEPASGPGGPEPSPPAGAATAPAPAGGRLVFVDDGSLVVVESDGTGRHAIPNGAGSDVYPAWSPDGLRLAYVHFEDDGRNQLRVVEAAGGDPVAVTALGSPTIDGPIDWAPDGSLLAFTGGSALHVVHPDGTGLRRITDPGLATDTEPSWSPDSSRLVFERDLRDVVTAHTQEIDAVGRDGTGLIRVSPANMQAKHPSWSPDGRRVAFLDVGPQGTGQITNVAGGKVWIADADGSDPHPLCTDNQGSWTPQWSPDGRWIAFDSGHQVIKVFSADGTSGGPLVPPEGAYDISPRWSPDGSRLAFLGATTGGSIWTMDPDGSNRTPLTWVAGSFFGLEWSPA